MALHVMRRQSVNELKKQVKFLYVVIVTYSLARAQKPSLASKHVVSNNHHEAIWTHSSIKPQTRAHQMIQI